MIQRYINTLSYLPILLFLAISQVALAEDLSRVQKLEEDVMLLKRTVVEQGKRIKALERHHSSGSVSPNLVPDSSSTQSNGANYNWHNPTNWGRVRSGMSESQVISILGQPTSVEALGGSIRTLFYQGEVGNSGFVSGNIKLHEDRVYMVSTPVF